MPGNRRFRIRAVNRRCRLIRSERIAPSLAKERRVAHPRRETMTKLFLMIGALVGLSACHASLGIGDNDRQQPVATSAADSAVAQASVATAVPAAD